MDPKRKLAIWKTTTAMSFTWLLLLFTASTCLSQNISTSNLTWQAVETTDLQTSATTALKCLFKTNANKSMEWIQKKGEMKGLFTITSVEGNWSNVSSAGSITYGLQSNGNSCKMIIEKNVSGTFITMDFSKPGEFTSLYKFKIISVQ
jgi:hypothetical protein